MAVNAAQFRLAFTEFASAKAYPDDALTMWLTFAYLFLAPNRWGPAIDLGAQLYAAHNLVLERLAWSEAANGATPGTFTGPISGKTVGELTISYDPGMGINKDDAQWGLTHYGTRFVKLARQFGSGPVQTQPGFTPIGQGFGVGFPMGPAWPGPWFENWSQ